MVYDAQIAGGNWFLLWSHLSYGYYHTQLQTSGETQESCWHDHSANKMFTVAFYNQRFLTITAFMRKIPKDLYIRTLNLETKIRHAFDSLYNHTVDVISYQYIIALTIRANRGHITYVLDSILR